MKRILSIFFAALAAFSLAPGAAARDSSPDVSAASAILIEASTGTPLFEKDADRRLPMASTTKIMTALVALERLSPDAAISVAPEACGVEGSSIYLRPGERMTAEDLLWAVLLESANDAAAALAYAAAGGIDEFAALMNEKAAEIGLPDTHFTNPHGLDDEEHYTTARDLAKLTVAAMANPAFRTVVASQKHTVEREGGARLLLNHNRLLRMSEDVVGVKTGFTRRSGRCLVSAAERDGVALVCVTLNAPDDWDDHLRLYEEGFSRCHAATLAVPGQFSADLPCPHASGGAVTVSNAEGLRQIFFDEAPKIDAVVEAKRFLLESVSAGDVLGEAVFFADGKPVASLPLYAEEDAVPPEPESFFSRIFRRG